MRYIAFLLLFCATLLAQESLKHHIAQAYTTAYKDYDIHITQISLQAPQSLQGHNLSCQAPNICTLSPNALAKSSGTLIAKIHNGASVVSVPISYSIDAELSVIKATALISTNADITSQNTATQRSKLALLKNTKLLPQSALGKVSARSIINPNTIITEDKVKERILVQKGDIITGILKEQNLQIQTQVQALQHGMKNEIIKVRNITTQKILRARVVDEKTAEIF